MRTIKLSYPQTLHVEELPETVAAIGFFDGIHLGHQKVIQTAVKTAKEKNMESAVITFHPHPSVILRQDVKSVNYITPLREKQDILRNLEVDRLYIIKFNKELSTLKPQEFIDHFIIGLHIKHLVAGFDFTFGFKGQGNMQSMEQYTRDAFSYSIVDKVEFAQEKISSTNIKKLLHSGEVEAANKLLGRPLTLTGMVIDGTKRGREIGFPTANLTINSDALLPKPGIYAVKIIYRNEYYEGMASLGTNPTFNEDAQDLKLEVNILDYNNDLYGEELQIEWHKFIRDEVKFPSVEALIEQIRKDEKEIRQYFY